MPNYVSRHSGEQIDNVIDQAILNSGGNMTGPLVLAADPAEDLEAVTKQYVDNVREDLDIPVQDIEPTDAEEGDLWVDTSEEGNTEEPEYIPIPGGATEGQILTYSNGVWVAADAPEGGVTSVNGQTGAVTVQAKITGTAGDFVVIGSDGNVTTKTIAYAEGASF